MESRRLKIGVAASLAGGVLVAASLAWVISAHGDNPAVTFTGAVASKITLGPTETLAPPPPGTQAVIGDQQAYQMALQYAPSGFSSSEVLFGLYTDTAVVQSSGDENTGPPELQDRLAWVIRLQGVCYPELGPPGASDGTSTPCSGYINIVIDSITGDFLEGFNS